MNYTGRYGLEINPFIKNGKDVLVETNEYKEGAIIAQSRAKDSVVTKGAELKITIAKKIETPEEVEPNPATPPEEQGTN